MGAFLLLLGFYLPVPPEPASEDEAIEEIQRRKALRRRALFAVGRLFSLVTGVFLLFINIPFGIGSIEDGSAFVLFLGLYGGLILRVQRAEQNRRLATLFFMGFCGLIVRRYAIFREYGSASDWATYAALLLNYLFAMTIGKRFPVGSSQDIHVWGMDE